MDGGDPAYLRDQIKDPAVSSYSLRNLLIASMPVRDDIQLAAIAREPAMDPWHLSQVLLAAGRLSPDVLIAVRAALAPYYYNLIMENQGNGDSWKPYVEAEMSGVLRDAERARHDFARKLLADTINDPLDSLWLVMTDAELPGTSVERFHLLLAQGEWAEAEDWLADPANYGLTSEEATVLAIVRDVMLDPEHAVATVEQAENDLQAVANEERYGGHVLARDLLVHYLGQTLEEPVELPGADRSMILATTDKPTANKWRMRVTPNPARDQLRVTTHLPMTEIMGHIVLYNAYGIELERTRIHSGPELIDMDVSKYAPGFYRIALFGRYDLLDGQSISIVR